MTEDPIVWKLHLQSDRETIYELWATDAGRERFWVEKSRQIGDAINLEFINGVQTIAKILNYEKPSFFSFEYFGSDVSIRLFDDIAGGVDLVLENRNVAREDYEDVLPGWLNVLLPLKAAADFGIDLRNHDPTRTWDQRYVDQ